MPGGMVSGRHRGGQEVRGDVGGMVGGWHRGGQEVRGDAGGDGVWAIPGGEGGAG